MKKYITIYAIIQLIVLPIKLHAQLNPMGETWVVIIENSDYRTFPTLTGPTKDALTLKNALADYEVNKIIHKINMNKKEMEDFFSAELPNSLNSNQVKSLMIWYAGHGQLVNNNGFWIPIDAVLNDESTYFGINYFKDQLKKYETIYHLLIVSDAGLVGPSFITAMRSVSQDPSSFNLEKINPRSAQILSSAGFESAADNSVFATTFAEAIKRNQKKFISIEEITIYINTNLSKENNQRPKFGRIQGLLDESGTFLLIKKDI